MAIEDHTNNVIRPAGFASEPVSNPKFRGGRPRNTLSFRMARQRRREALRTLRDTEAESLQQLEPPAGSQRVRSRWDILSRLCDAAMRMPNRVRLEQFLDRVEAIAAEMSS